MSGSPGGWFTVIRRRALLGVALLVTSVPLTACAGGSATPSGSTAGATAAAAVTTPVSTPLTATLSPSPATPATSFTTTPTTLAATPEAAAGCHASQLRAALGAQGGATGHDVAVITLQNSSGTACTLDGYPGLQLRGAQGNPLPTTVGHRLDTYLGFSNVAPSPQVVSLAPGASGSFDVTYSPNPSGSQTEAMCAPSAQVAVTPPDAGHPLVIPARLAACGGQLEVSPVVAGSQGVARGH